MKHAQNFILIVGTKLMNKLRPINSSYKNSRRRKYKPLADTTNATNSAWWHAGYYEAKKLENAIKSGKYVCAPPIYNDNGGLNMDFFHKYNPDDDLI